MMRWRDGEMERWRGGEMEGGEMERWKDDGMETWTDGEIEMWRHGDVEMWIQGEMETNMRDGEVKRWRGGQVGRWREGEMERQGERELEKWRHPRGPAVLPAVCACLSPVHLPLCLREELFAGISFMARSTAAPVCSTLGEFWGRDRAWWGGARQVLTGGQSWQSQSGGHAAGQPAVPPEAPLGAGTSLPVLSGVPLALSLHLLCHHHLRSVWPWVGVSTPCAPGPHRSLLLLLCLELRPCHANTQHCSVPQNPAQKAREGFCTLTTSTVCWDDGLLFLVNLAMSQALLFIIMA